MTAKFLYRVAIMLITVSLAYANDPASLELFVETQPHLTMVDNTFVISARIQARTSVNSANYNWGVEGGGFTIKGSGSIISIETTISSLIGVCVAGTVTCQIRNGNDMLSDDCEVIWYSMFPSTSSINGPTVLSSESLTFPINYTFNWAD